MTISEAASYLARRDDFIVTSHESPDADGLGAEFAIATALASLGKRATVVNAERYSPAYAFIDPTNIILSLKDAALSDEAIGRCTAILVDTNDMMYTGEVADKIIAKARDVIIIDHHEVKSRSAAALCSHPGSSSTCEIAYRIILEMGYDIGRDVASALFAGMVYDTGSFAYSKTSADTFAAALDLVRRGADPTRIHGALYESSAIGVLLLRKAVLSTLELFADNRVAAQTLTQAILEETGSSSQDAEGLINVPLQAARIEASIFFKENEEGTLRCSLRSKGTINVAQIAQSFGGGGHKSAAGFKSPYPLETIKAKVLERVISALPELRT
ncbi:MAG: bifunctional oligoribonuclease/PAP phosphatase NrnA [Spirochaetes bacterium]|nr:bifunctional oligoribonuclease/PAP phosphatase NrnA [Spirochaetota bacterium]MBU1080637.1 bifunctional oligoribonuclease/PAP phosphatase NrnA [Spirochaetota bacterium]